MKELQPCGDAAYQCLPQLMSSRGYITELSAQQVQSSTASAKLYLLQKFKGNVLVTWVLLVRLSLLFADIKHVTCSRWLIFKVPMAAATCYCYNVYDLDLGCANIFSVVPMFPL